MSLKLYNYRHSVYSWIARLALAEKGLVYDLIEIDPFEDNPADEFLEINPLCRVPALIHNGFQLFETAAMTRYLDEAFSGPTLQPQSGQSKARQNQIIAVIDYDAYWPLVRQVFVQTFYNPLVSEPTDESEQTKGLQRSTEVLSVLEGLASGGKFLVGKEFSLADIHLFPMIAYFSASEEGREALAKFEKLFAWFNHQKRRPSFRMTCPEFLDLT